MHQRNKQTNHNPSKICECDKDIDKQLREKAAAVAAKEEKYANKNGINSQRKI